ncbi:MAG: hypothetical protein ACREJD_03955 [Phycisphaerales bacterium]
MNTKTGILLLAGGSLALVALGGCTSVRYTQGELSSREPEVATVTPSSAPSQASKWAAVLPSDDVNTSPLAMAEYNEELGRNDAALGVVTGPPGEPMAYYASAEPPSLYLQYQFTLPSTANSVTVFRRGNDPTIIRPFRGFYRVP